LHQWAILFPALGKAGLYRLRKNPKAMSITEKGKKIAIVFVEKFWDVPFSGSADRDPSLP
jgi:hypothetical protein